MLIPAWILYLVLGAGLGTGGTLLLTRDGGAESVAAVADSIEATATVVENVGDAANAERLAELSLQESIASSDVKIIGMKRLVEIGDPRLIGSIVAYDVCLSGAQGKGDSAAFNCEEAQIDVHLALEAVIQPVSQ